MKKINFLIMGILFSIGGTVLGQDVSWEPQTKLTGYIATEFNYFKNVEGFDRDYALAVSEAGFLSIYQPTENITIKGVLVYRPNYTFEQMLNEANAQYKVTDKFKVKAGRFLTPLSPMNTYYYAPVNTSATLPMIISNHEFFPLNMDAVSVNGIFGNDFKFDYDVFAGGFRNSLWQKIGAIGFFGQENQYFTNQMPPVETGFESESDPNESLQFGGGVHAGFVYKDLITLGLNLFNSRESVSKTYFFEDAVDPEIITEFAYTEKSKKMSYGANLKIKKSSFQLLSEYWQTKVTVDFLGMTDFELNYKGAFVEVSNNFGKITPYARYEFHEVPGMLADQDYYRYTGGINYKPIFETTFKLEYVHYKYEELSQGGLIATAIFSF